MLSSLVKEAYESKKSIEKEGIAVYPDKNKIKIGLNILEAEGWVRTYAGAVATDKVKEIAKLLKNLCQYLLGKGFEAEFSENEEFSKWTYKLDLSKDNKKLFEITEEYKPPQCYWTGFVLPWHDLEIEKFSYSDYSLVALEHLFSFKDLQNYYQKYLISPPKEIDLA